MKFTAYQQIEFMVDNHVTVTIDHDYENSKVIVSVSRTSAFAYSVTHESMATAIEKAFDKVSVYMGHETTIED